MGRKHFSRLAAPKHWRIKRRGLKWITKPKPGAHSIKLGIPLNLVIRDLLGYAKTNREVKKILNNQEVIVDGRRRKEPRFNVGLMDVISLPKLKEHFRILLNKKGKLALLMIKADESKIKPCKIIGKRQIKEKTQINLYDGKNILVKDAHKVGDSLLIELKNLKIKDVLPFETGNTIYLIAGKHVGEVGRISKIKDSMIMVKTKDNEFETLKEHGFIIGREKALISLFKDGKAT